MTSPVIHSNSAPNATAILPSDHPLAIARSNAMIDVGSLASITELPDEITASLSGVSDDDGDADLTESGV
jgi:hypothetical protein